MNLRPRGLAADAATAALDVMAAGRFLAGAGIPGGRIWVLEQGSDDAPLGMTPLAAWARGTAVVRVSGVAARDAALATAATLGMAASTDPPASDMEALREDAGRLAARLELGLMPDETVEVVLGEAALRDLEARLAVLDSALANEPVPRRLVLAGLREHGPDLGPDLVAAIVHPAVLVESAPSDASQLELLRLAADQVVEG